MKHLSTIFYVATKCTMVLALCAIAIAAPLSLTSAQEKVVNITPLLPPGTFDFNPLTWGGAAQGKFIFFAPNTSGQFSIWALDGADGATLLKSLAPATSQELYGGVASTAREYYFQMYRSSDAASPSLFVSDGSTLGTRPVMLGDSEFGENFCDTLSEVKVGTDRLFFQAFNCSASANTRVKNGLYAVTGNTAKHLADFTSEASYMNRGDRTEYSVVRGNDLFFFLKNWPYEGTNLWRTDSSLTRATLLKNFLLPGEKPGVPPAWPTVGGDGRVFSWIEDGRHIGLGVSDGTTPGTQLFLGNIDNYLTLTTVL